MKLGRSSGSIPYESAENPIMITNEKIAVAEKTIPIPKFLEVGVCTGTFVIDTKSLEHCWHGTEWKQNEGYKSRQ